MGNLMIWMIIEIASYKMLNTRKIFQSIDHSWDLVIKILNQNFLCELKMNGDRDQKFYL